MAKISARGAREVGRFRNDRAEYVLTSDGRVLRKIRYEGGGSSSYTLVGRGYDEARFLALKQAMGGEAAR